MKAFNRLTLGTALRISPPPRSRESGKLGQPLRGHDFHVPPPADKPGGIGGDVMGHAGGRPEGVAPIGVAFHVRKAGN